MTAMRSRAIRAARLCGAGALVVAIGCVQMPEPLDAEGVFDDEAPIVQAEPEADLQAEVSREPRSGRSPWDDVVHDYSTWPLSAEPTAARIGVREPRTHALWPTPIDDPCPSVSFAMVGPIIEGGETFERVGKRLGGIADRRFGLRPTHVVLLHDHIDAPGLRLWAAAHTAGACMMSWSHTHCLVDDRDVYCPDGSTDELERLIAARKLAPSSLSEAGWLELVVVLLGVDRLVVDPSLVGECTYVKGATASAPSVELAEHGVTVRFTSIDERGGVDHTVTIDGEGRVHVETEPRWTLPPPE